MTAEKKFPVLLHATMHCSSFKSLFFTKLLKKCLSLNANVLWMARSCVVAKVF